MPSLNMRYIYVLYILCYDMHGFETSHVEFIAIQKRYFEASPSQLEQLSNIQCCTKCGQDENCLATNYNRETSGCELLMQKPMIREDFEAKRNWTMYINTDFHDSDWLQFNQSRYLLVKDYKSWEHADGHCIGLNAELVDIHSPEENDFVVDLVSSFNMRYVWIGLNDRDVESTYSWSSGGPFTYDAFGKGEPNDIGGTEDCVEIRYMRLWNDRTCSRLCASICKKHIN